MPCTAVLAMWNGAACRLPVLSSLLALLAFSPAHNIVIYHAAFNAVFRVLTRLASREITAKGVD